MKNKFLLSVMFLLVILGIYSPTSFSQTYRMWVTNDVLTGNAWSFDVYIQRTGVTPLSVYSFQIGFTYTTAALNGGTMAGVWSNVDATIQSVETPKAISTATAGYVKCGFNVNSGGSGQGITVVSEPDSMKIGTITLTNSVPFTAFPLLTWYFGGAPGLPTKIQATDGTLAFNVTANGTFTYVNPHGGILPVELSSFASTIQGRTVVLNWETKTEMNTRQFEVERSSTSNNGVISSWSTVGSLQAAGNSVSSKQYNFTEKNLQAGKYQYRLKMIDNDGTFKYSKVVESEIALPKDFAVSQNYPNPFNPSTTIAYQVPVDAKVIM
jgi:hypothetical protein